VRSSSLVRLGGPALFVLLWSTGFVGAKYGLPYADPFPFLAVRLALAAALLALLAAVTRSPWPTRDQYGRAAVVGVLLHAGYLGGVFTGIALGVPAGVAAVVTSLQPVLTALLAVRILRERLRPGQVVGLVVGVVGVVLVLAPGLRASAGASGALPAAGLLACVVALLSGTAATLYQKRHGGEVPLLSGTAVQYAAATGVLLVATAVTREHTVRWTGEFVLALAWLVLVLSLGAVLLLLVLLRRGSAAGVSSLLYLVPPATALEALVLFGERLAAVSVVGVVVAALGVALVVRPAGAERPA
jgi:drug/metabolite transporter (DMT)-like permease